MYSIPPTVNFTKADFTMQAGLRYEARHGGWWHMLYNESSN